MLRGQDNVGPPTAGTYSGFGTIFTPGVNLTNAKNFVSSQAWGPVSLAVRFRPFRALRTRSSATDLSFARGWLERKVLPMPVSDDAHIVPNRLGLGPCSLVAVRSQGG